MRSFARETIFKYIFSQLFNPTDEGLFSVLLKDGKIKGDLSDSDAAFAQELLDFINKNQDKYLEYIGENSIGFSLDRILSADKCALIIGMAELDNYPNTPVPVVIDEAVKIAAKYSTEKSTDFVNGILGKYASEKENG